jgi:hypothetical protein
VTISSRGTSEFWQRYRALPAAARMLAQKNYRLWSANAFHPSLHFKSVGKTDWSVRVGAHYRAVGKFSGNTFLWEWIGSHEEYNKRF